MQQAEQATGVDWKHIQKIESAELNVTLVTLCRLSDGLNVSVAALLKVRGAK